jgi:Transport and Golgi organisation 2
MCTFSYYIGKEEIIFTSNRDEVPARSAGLEVQHLPLKDGWIFFTKDKLSGGTWIGINSRKEVYCLLNGADRNHDPRLHPVSRGAVITELLSGGEILQQKELLGMAPFTLVSFKNEILMKNTFDENQFINSQIINQHWGIFSSSTLYNSKEKEKHQRLFSEVIGSHINENKLFEFHQRDDIRYESQVLERQSSFIRTVTTTQFIIRGNTVRIRLRDQASQLENEYKFSI